MNRKLLSIGMVVAGLTALAIFMMPALAQDKPATTVPPPPAKEVTIAGKLVDLHCLMAGCPAKEDPAKCFVECVKNGVPVAVETPTGLVILGNMKGIGKMVEPLALQNVEAKGKLYEKHGVKYLDLLSIQKVAEKPTTPPAKPAEKPTTPPAKPADKPATPPATGH